VSIDATVLNDLVYSVRTLRASPVLAFAAITTVALGIAASTAIFTVAEAVLLRPLPYKAADRLVVATAEMRHRNTVDLPLSAPDYFDLRRGAATMFEDFAAVQTGRTVVRHDDGTVEQVRFASVSPNFLTLLGATVVIGRTFTDADGQPLTEKDAVPGQPHLRRPSTVAVLSYEYWQRRYGGNAAVLGQGLSGSRSGATIVGILAPGFELLFPPNQNVERSPDVWVAARLSSDASQRPMLSHRVVGRLRDGVGLEAARGEADAVAAGLRKNFPLWNTAGFHIGLEPFHRYLVAQAEPALTALMVAAICLLLVACANVANLLLVRASLREREFAVRAALGGTAWRLVRQMLAEALVLAGAGTIVGMALAWGGLRVLLALAPSNLPRLESVGLNPLAFSFAVLLGVGAAAVFGVAPALRGSRTDTMASLRMAGSTAGLEKGRVLRASVVVGEIALSLMLLVGSGLMLRSFIALRAIDPGFVAPGLLTFELLGFQEYTTPERRHAMMRAVHAALSAIPGVERATAASPFPLADQIYPIRWGKEEALTDPSKFQAVDYHIVLPGYFETLGTRLIAGRTFVDADNAPERRIVVIDHVLASKAFPGGAAVGQRILIRIRTPQPEWVEVVGVVAHQRARSLADAGREQVYFTDGFLGHGAASRWAVRTTRDPAQYQTALRSAVSRVGGQLVATEFQTMDSLVDRSQAGTRFSFVLLVVLASAAALLAATGIYGVLSTNVRQRTAEIGVRLALGATPSSVFGLVVRQGLALSAAGIAIGVVAGLGLAQTLTSMLVGVSARDPMTFLASTALFLFVAATASVLPARRAAAVDPTTALRGG
jgi:predicted permease